MKIVAVVEKGAVDDVEDLRSMLGVPGTIIQTHRGRGVKIHQLGEQHPIHVIYEKGAVDDLAELRTELTREIGIAVVNAGFDFKVMEVRDGVLVRSPDVLVD